MTKKNKTYTELKKELESTVAELQSSDIDVDAALGLYDKAELLIKTLEDRIAQAENSIEQRVVGGKNKAEK